MTTTNAFTPSHIASLRELAEKATKGPMLTGRK